MNPFRPLSRLSALRRGPLALQRTDTLLKLSCNYKFREVASSVSGRPASQTIEHAVTNVKEEVGNSAADLAKSIAGGTPMKRFDTFVSNIPPHCCKPNNDNKATVGYN